MIDVNSYFTSIAGLAGVTVLLTGWVNTHLLKWDGWKAQLLSWVVAIGLGVLGKWQGLGIFADTNWLWTAIQGIGAGLVANGLYSADLIQSLLTLLKAKPKATT